MDGKYAKYIQNFMKSYKIKGDKIEIQTNKNDRNKPLVYDLTPENIELCNKKLDEQYQILIDKQDAIKKSETSKSKIFTIINIVISVLCFVGTLVVPASIALPLAALKIGTVLFAGMAGIGGLTVLAKDIDFNNLVSIAKGYKNNRENIEVIMEQDENITKYLKTNTKKMISEKQEQVQKGNTNEVLDIGLMDEILAKKATGRRELITLLNMYKSVINLREQPTYITPVQEKKSNKKRTRKKEDK